MALKFSLQSWQNLPWFQSWASLRHIRFEIHFNIILPFVPIFLMVYLLSVPTTKHLYKPPFCSMRATCPSHLTLFNLASPKVSVLTICLRWQKLNNFAIFQYSLPLLIHRCEKCVEMKGHYWKIAKFFNFCHPKKLVRPKTFGPYYVIHCAVFFIFRAPASPRRSKCSPQHSLLRTLYCKRLSFPPIRKNTQNHVYVLQPWRQ
jgi:hypothetical protein